jgi:hypothetical protein
MRPSLLPRLVNGPFEDPALFIRFLFENRMSLRSGFLIFLAEPKVISLFWILNPDSCILYRIASG